MSATGAAAPWRGGHKRGNLGHRKLIMAFAGGFVLLLLLALIGALVGKPPAPKAVCAKGKVCSTPPPPTLPGVPRLQVAQHFTSSGLGYGFDYPMPLQASSVTATDVTIAPPVSTPVLSLQFHGAPASQASPQQMMQRALSALHDHIPDLQAGSDPALEILAPALGGHAGVGGFYQGTLSSPDGFVGPVDVAVLAATDGQATVSVAVVCADRSRTDAAFGFADQNILESLRFPKDVPQ